MISSKAIEAVFKAMNLDRKVSSRDKF